MMKKIGNKLYEKMLNRYGSLETVWGIWVPSVYAPVIDVLFSVLTVLFVAAVFSAAFTVILSWWIT